jgi:hypothetical protein
VKSGSQRLLFLLLGFFINLLEILGWFLVEVLEAGLAAELDSLAFVNEFVGRHPAALEFLVRHDALGEWVRLGLPVGGFVSGAGAQDSGSEAGEQNRSEDVYRELPTYFLSLVSLCCTAIQRRNCFMTCVLFFRSSMLRSDSRAFQ